MKKYKVLLDTNMLMLIGKGIDVFTQIEDLLEAKVEFYVIKPVLKELEKIATKGNLKERKSARLALNLINKYCKVIEIEKPSGTSVDELLAYLASRQGFIVATNDKELRRKLRERGIPEIYFREEKHLLEAQGIA